MFVVLLLWVAFALMVSSFACCSVASALRSRLGACIAQAGRLARAGREAACGAQPKASTERGNGTAKRILAWWPDCAMRRKEADRRGDETCLEQLAKDGEQNQEVPQQQYHGAGPPGGPAF